MFIHSLGGGACSGVPVEVGGQIAGIGYLLPLCGSRELNSGYQVWLQVQLSIKPSPCLEKINNEHSFLLSILFLIFKRIKIKTTAKNLITKRITHYTRNETCLTTQRGVNYKMKCIKKHLMTWEVYRLDH